MGNVNVCGSEVEKENAEFTPKRIAIIGGGPSGIFAAYGMKSVKNAEITIFEQQQQLGGMWIYDARVDSDADNTIPNCMYNNLSINAPKECLEIPTFTYDDAFNGINLPSFPQAPVILEYLHRFVKKEGLDEYAKCNTRVQNVSFDKNSKVFTLTAQNDNTKSKTTEEFDHVIVATGHFSAKNYPDETDFAGIETFEGQILHSGDLRGLDVLRNKRVLAIGASYSAESVICEGYKAGAEKVTSCFRTNPIRVPIRPEQCEYVCDQHGPGISKIEGSKITFGDGHEDTFDIIVYCTGFKHTYPFLESSLRLECKSGYYLSHLYKGIVFQENPQLYYIGAQNLAYSFPLFLNSALWLANLLNDSFTLPSLKEMEAHTEKWVKKNDAIAAILDVLDVQEGHLQELADDCGNPAEMDCIHREKFIAWETDRAGNIFTHRESCFTSKFTGIKACPPHNPWKDAMGLAECVGPESMIELNLLKE